MGLTAAGPTPWALAVVLALALAVAVANGRWAEGAVVLAGLVAGGVALVRRRPV